MNVLVELQADIWPEALETIKNAGFVAAEDPTKYCGASMIVEGNLPRSCLKACSNVPGVIGIWENLTSGPQRTHEDFGPRIEKKY